MKSIYRTPNSITRALATFILMYAGLASCLSPASHLPTSTTPIGQALSETETGSQATNSPAGSQRRLAYIGADGNVYVTTADRQQTIAVTDDATAPPESQGLSYHRLSWSPDGQLAFASVKRTGNQASSRLYVVESPGEPARLVAEDDEHFVIYIYWSPVPCPDQPSCRRLAYLIEEEGGVSLRVVELKAPDTRNQFVGVGRPFYFSWSPDGQAILWHTNGTHRHNADAQIAHYDANRDRVSDLPHPPGSFMAPAWSPQGDRWLAVSASKETDHLQIFASNQNTAGNSDQVTTITTTLGTEIAFTWSPQGNQVAFAVRPWIDAPFYGPLHVFDLDTGKSQQVTGDGFRILGFFWAPDGARIGYLTRLDLPNEVWMQWRVYNLAADQDRGFTAFHPAPLMSFMIHSFNQYAQSHRFWSPDGRYLVYADRDAVLAVQVWLVDTWAEKGADPVLVGRGSIGVWSWN